MLINARTATDQELLSLIDTEFWDHPMVSELVRRFENITSEYEDTVRADNAAIEKLENDIDDLLNTEVESLKTEIDTLEEEIERLKNEQPN